MMDEILTESSMIKLLTNKEFVVEIYEEIIEVNKEKGKIENYIVMVEQAINDMSKIVNIWANQVQSS